MIGSASSQPIRQCKQPIFKFSIFYYMILFMIINFVLNLFSHLSCLICLSLSHYLHTAQHIHHTHPQLHHETFSALGVLQS